MLQKPCALLPIFLLITLQAAIAQPISQVFNASGTYLVPAGYHASVSIDVWGAGGSGGGGGPVDNERAGGGGGGYAGKILTLGQGNYAVTVGTGGMAPTNIAAGQNGNLSTFAALLTANGGMGANGNVAGAGGAGVAGAGITVYTGGAGATGSGPGGGGGAGANNSSNGTNATGSNGGNGGGKGGNGGIEPSGSGENGFVPGGGGGGKADLGAMSGNGANGRVVVTVLSILPVKLSNIKAYQKQQGIQIEWTAELEQGLSRYSVERSADAITFSSIGEVSVRNLTIPANYGFFDANPLPGVSFYRLKSIDVDGRFTNSEVLKIIFNNLEAAVSIYPNPVTSRHIFIQATNLTKGNYMVKVFNSSGILQATALNFLHAGGPVNQPLKLAANTPPGVYLLQLFSNAAKPINKTFIVL